MKLKPIDEQIIVLTGATSGIGLATARLAASRGARVVLASRDETALRKLVAEFDAQGGEAIGVVADVGVLADIEALAAAAVKRFGRIDAWVNNAGTSIFGKLEEVPHEDSRKLFETNFWGVVYGSLAAVKHFRSRGKPAALINVGSVLSDRAIPIQGMYCATKHAVKAFTDALRMELEADGAAISVTLVKPSSINTPFPARARNWMEREPRLPPPIYSPRVVADAILHCVEHPRRDVTIGAGGRLLAWAGDNLPRLTDRVMQGTMIEAQQKGPLERDREGAFEHPHAHIAEEGKATSHVSRSSLYTTAVLHPVATGMVALGVGIGLGLLRERMRGTVS